MAARKVQGKRVVKAAAPVRAMAAEVEEKFDARAYRRELGKTKTYTRKFANDPEAAQQMEEQGIGYSTSASSRRAQAA